MGLPPIGPAPKWTGPRYALVAFQPSRPASPEQIWYVTDDRARVQADVDKHNARPGGHTKFKVKELLP